MENSSWAEDLKDLSPRSSRNHDSLEEFIPETPDQDHAEDDSEHEQENKDGDHYIFDNEDPIEANCNPMKAKQFRVNAHKIFVTYARCGLTKDVMLAFFKSKGRLKHYVICVEKHKDGTPHIHAALWYMDKPDIRSPRYFDVETYHPNFGSVRSWPNCCMYCKKGGDFIESVSFDDSTSDNFSRRQADHEMWTAYHQQKQRVEVDWPVEIKHVDTSLDTVSLTWDPTHRGKQRHLWICGAPNSGKSTWLQETFEGKRVFLRRPHQYPFEGYDKESLILYDDITPTFIELTQVSNIHKIAQHVFGAVRYKQLFWPLGVDLVMIVLSNKHIDEVYEASELNAVRARFVELEVNRLY